MRSKTYAAPVRRGKGIGFAAMVVAAAGTMALLSAPAGAGQQAAADDVVVQPFEPDGVYHRFNTFGYEWPGNPAVITVDNRLRKLRDPIKKALSVWNHSGVNVRFKLKSGGGADVKVVKYGDAPCGNGLATTNYNGNGKAYAAIVYLGTNSNTKKCKFTDVITAAHEFGHVLGLDHEDGECAVMNSLNMSAPSGTHPNAAWPFRCDAQTDMWYCRVLSQDDLRGAKSIYGGNFTVKDPEFCPVSQPLR